MAMKTFCSQIKHRQLDVRKTKREENEEKDADCFELVSCCPACNQHYDVALILPCSHTMCGRCIAAEARTSSGQPLLRGVGLSVWSVLCPCCRHHVELPCWTCSSATSCLPEHPTLSPTCISQETSAKKGASKDNLQHIQGDTHSRDAAKETTQSYLCGSESTGFPTTPAGGDIDLQEDEMAQSVFGLRFALDPSSVPPSLHLSNTSLTVSYRGPPSPALDNKVRGQKMTPDLRVPFALPQVCADVVIARGQYYWEVDVCNSCMYRIGVISLDGCSGWWLERQGASFFVVYDGNWEPLYTVPPQIKSLGVFLNIGGGALSFHNPLSQEHLVTLPTRFGTAGVLPALGLGQGWLRMRCSLPPPPHIFLSKDSTYKGHCGTGGGWWRRETPFHSVRKVIQKFEELAASDSDSGLVSSFGSSCSDVASLQDQDRCFPLGTQDRKLKLNKKSFLFSGSIKNTPAAPLSGLISSCHLKG